MSKVQQAKAAQGYTEKSGTCATCTHQINEQSLPEWMIGNQNYDTDARRDNYMVVKNRRCGIGGFAIKQSATCQRYEKGHTA